MGFLKIITIIILILFAINYFTPDTFQLGKDKVTTYTKEKVKGWVLEGMTGGGNREASLNKYTYKINNESITFGNLNGEDCTNQTECEEFYNIVGLECVEGTCQINT